MNYIKDKGFIAYLRTKKIYPHHTNVRLNDKQKYEVLFAYEQPIDHWKYEYETNGLAKAKEIVLEFIETGKIIRFELEKRKIDSFGNRANIKVDSIYKD